VQSENELDVVAEPVSVIAPSARVLTVATPASAKNTTDVVTAQDINSFQEMLKESLAMDMTY
jgi:hypothetical protein